MTMCMDNINYVSVFKKDIQPHYHEGNADYHHDGMCYVLCLVAQLCLTLCDPMDCSPPGSCVHGIL